MPKISAVICVKDRSEYLRACLASLVDQTEADWECVIVDDHSSEDLEAVVKEFNDPRFRYFKNPGAPGISSARNFGNRQARSEWIAVVDSDDINLPQRFARSLECLAAYPEADVFYANISSFGAGSGTFRPSRRWRPYDRDLLYEYNFIAHPTAVYRREKVLETNYDEGLPRCVDYDLWLSLADKRIGFYGLNEVLVLYRLHEGQTAHTVPAELDGRRIVERIWEAHLPYR